MKGRFINYIKVSIYYIKSCFSYVNIMPTKYNCLIKTAWKNSPGIFANFPCMIRLSE